MWYIHSKPRNYNLKNYLCFIAIIFTIFCTFTPCSSTSSSLSSSKQELVNGSITTRIQKREGSNKSNNENFLWKLFSRGKSFLFGTSNMSQANSSKRVDRRQQHYDFEEASPQIPSFFHSSQTQNDYDTPEHRIVNDGPQNSAQNSGVEIGIENNEYAGPVVPKEGGDSGGWGWSSSYYAHDNGAHHMQLYTLIGGLSFAAFLSTSLILLTRRNGTSIFRSSSNSPTKTVSNYLLSNRRKVDIIDEQIEQSYDRFVKVPELVYKLSKIFSPFWFVIRNEEEADNKNKKERKQGTESDRYDSNENEKSFVPVKVTPYEN